MSEKEVLSNRFCKKHRSSVLDDLKITRTYLIGSCVYHFVNRFNPLTWIFFIIFSLLIPFGCLFTEMTIQEGYGLIFKMILKGEM